MESDSSDNNYQLKLNLKEDLSSFISELDDNPSEQITTLINFMQQNGITNVEELIEAFSFRKEQLNKKINNLFKKRQNKSPEENSDKAKLNYRTIFEEAKNICPDMTWIIGYIEKIPPPQKGEYDQNFNEIFRKTVHSEIATEKIFNWSLRFAVKDALNFHKKFDVELEDAFQEACIGIISAIKNYNIEVRGYYPSYVAMWIKQRLETKLQLFNKELHIPVHIRKRIIKVLNQINISPQELAKYYCADDLFELLVKKSDCNNEEALMIINLLLPFRSIEDLYHIFNDEEIDKFFSEEINPINNLLEKEQEKRISSFMYTRLPERDRLIIMQRFGLYDGVGKTLEEVGDLVGLTRERVRQIELHTLADLRKFLL